MTEHPVVATPLPDGADRAYAKSIALRYLIASTVILGASGLLGMILRDSQAGAGRVPDAWYYAIMTAHGLGAFVGQVAADQPLAPGILGKERLVAALAVVADDLRRRADDGRGRAVVLFELHDSRAGIVALEVEDVSDVGAPPLVDGLVLVADHADVSVRFGQKFCDVVLNAICILVFVN